MTLLIFYCQDLKPESVAAQSPTFTKILRDKNKEELSKAFKLMRRSIPNLLSLMKIRH